MSEIFNTIDRTTWREIKETLQWPPMENRLVVYTQLDALRRSAARHCVRHRDIGQLGGGIECAVKLLTNQEQRRLRRQITGGCAFVIVILTNIGSVRQSFIDQ